MKRILWPAMLLLLGFGASCACAQAVDYDLCGADFRPLSMHKDLPAGAVYTNPKASPEARAHDVVARLTFDEKLALTGGWKQFHFPGVARLGIPPVYFSDASQGIHQKNYCVKVGDTTAFPDMEALAATWDRKAAYRYARAISEEARGYGISVLLGPGLNLYRNSEGGRNFEYMGEDPYLTGEMGVSYVQGMQSLGTIATVKHFLGNEQEAARHTANSIIGERALRELYLEPFRAAIERGGALAVMTGNNLVNGHPGAADTPLVQGILRNEYGFRGVVMSDWANSMFWKDRLSEELTSGHSLLMENNDLFAQYVRSEVAAHPEKKTLIEAQLGRMVEENLYSFFKAGVYDRPYRDPTLLSSLPGHKQVARETADEAITLLKNADHILPIMPDTVGKIAVVGSDNAITVSTGKGSGAVKGYDLVDYFAGLKAIYGERVFRTDKDEDIRSAGCVLFFVAKKAGESTDIPWEMPGLSEQVHHYASLNKNLVVIVSAGNGIPLDWLGEAKALVFAYFLGQESGHAMADVLSGVVNPSGKLPFTIEKDFRESPAFDYNKLPDGSYAWLGGRRDSMQIQQKLGTLPIRYKEGPYIGYRWYEKKNLPVSFPFGFGLSYTKFSYGNVKVSSATVRDDAPVNVRFTIQNTGSRAGAEIAQLYVAEHDASVDRPLKELKGFERVFLKPGEKKVVEIPVHAEDLAYWDDREHRWEKHHGQYVLEVASSSADIRGRVMVSY